MINFINIQDHKYPEKLIKGVKMELGHKTEYLTNRFISWQP